jgi:hypothetical protein
MVNVVFINPKNNETLLSIETDNTCVNVGDIIVIPGKPDTEAVYSVVQRAYIFTQAPIDMNNIGAKRPLSVELQCAVLPAEMRAVDAE